MARSLLILIILQYFLSDDSCTFIYCLVNHSTHSTVKKKMEKQHPTEFDVFVLEVSDLHSGASLMQIPKDISGKRRLTG